MLAAVLSGKRRGTGLAGKSLILGNLEGAEDVLTATVFERLAYLPDIIFSVFMQKLLPSDEPLGALDEIQFWPSWELSGHRIEPDAVLFCGERSILVEAKRNDNGLQQYASQLAKELKAGCEENTLKDNPILLTVGGLLDYSRKAELDLCNDINNELGRTKIKYELACRSWHDIFLALKYAIKSAGDISSLGAERLLNDIADVYEWHGLRTHEHHWLTQLMSTGIQRTCYPGGRFHFDQESAGSPSAHLSQTLSQLKSDRITCAEFPIKTWRWNHA